MAAHERIITNTSIASSALLQRLATALPKDVSFKIYHLSTPPTRTSAIYSAPPSTRPDRTYCENHFLTVSIRTSTKDNGSDSEEVLVFAIEVLIYSTAYDTTFFVSKADSTGYLHLLDLPKGTPSPLRDISGTFLRHLVKEHQRSNIRSVVSLFARAQDQYLFPGSVEYNGKHVLDDRGLVRWWCRVLDPLVDNSTTSLQPGSSTWDSVKGYLVVPGLDSHETRTYIPKTSGSNSQHWTMGHPLLEISRHNDVPPRCLIPHFPDDPKARFLVELDDEITKGQENLNGQWKSIKTIDQFWDMMAFRQECSAGRLVGFIWIVFTPNVQEESSEPVLTDSQSTAMTVESQTWDSDRALPTALDNLANTPLTSSAFSSQVQPISSPNKPNDTQLSFTREPVVPPKLRTPRKKKRKLSGPIIPREPKIKTENKNYLLDKPEITAYYSWLPEGRGQVVVEESDYKRITELLLRLDFANLELSTSSSRRWINEVRSSTSGAMGDAWGQTVKGTKVIESLEVAGAAGVNTLNMGLVRKKRKGGAEPLIDTAPATTANIPTPVVNVLGGGMVRKKAKV